MNIEEMKSSALKATQGDWVRIKEGNEDALISINHNLTPQEMKEQDLSPYWDDVRKYNDHKIARVLDSSEWMNCSDRNLNFMTACCPKKVLELIHAYEQIVDKQR